MQLFGDERDEAAEHAIESPERRLYNRLTVDFGLDSGPVDLSSLVDNIQTDRTLKGSAPEEVMLIEGSSAAELSFELSGDLELDGYDPIDAVAAFSPYNGLSPFYYVPELETIGAEVVWELGIATVLGTVWYPQFVGNLRTVNPVRHNGVVNFTALDRVEKLRHPVQFAPWAVNRNKLRDGHRWAQMMNSQSVIDHCLREADVSPTSKRPKTRVEMNLPAEHTTADGCLVWVSGTGSYDPLIGWNARNSYDTFPEVESFGDGVGSLYEQLGDQHPDVADDPSNPKPLAFRHYKVRPQSPAGYHERNKAYWVSDRNLLQVQGTYYLGMTLVLDPDAYIPNYPYNSPNRYLMSVHIWGELAFYIWHDGDEVWGALVRGDPYNSPEAIERSARMKLPRDQRTVELVVAVTQVDPAVPEARNEIYIRLGNTAVGPNPIPYISANPPGTFEVRGLVRINNNIGFNDAWMSYRNTTGIVTDRNNPASGIPLPAKYPAVLDKGLQQFSHLPIRNGDDAWDVITDVAAAEFASAFWDEQGVFRFWNARRLQDLRSQSVKSLTLDQVSGLEIEDSLDSVRNVLSIEQNRGVTKSNRGVIYASDDVEEFRVEGESTGLFRIWSENVQAPDPFFPSRYTTETWGYSEPLWNDHITSGYVVQWLYNGQWQQMRRQLSAEHVNCYFTATGELMVRINNPWPEPVRFARFPSEEWIANPGTADSTVEHREDPSRDAIPAFHLAGVTVDKPQSHTLTHRNEESISKFGKRNIQLSGDWVQERIVDSDLDAYLLDRMSQPIPTTDNVQVAGDPRIQLGDTIEVSDPDGMGEELRIQVYGISRSFSLDGGLRDTYTVELVRPAGVGIWDSEQYGRWDETFIWS